MKILGAALVGLWAGYILGFMLGSTAAGRRYEAQLKTIQAQLKTIQAQQEAIEARQNALRGFYLDDGLKSLEKKADKIEGTLRGLLDPGHATLIHEPLGGCPKGTTVLRGLFLEKDGTRENGCERPDGNGTLDVLKPGEGFSFSVEVPRPPAPRAKL